MDNKQKIALLKLAERLKNEELTKEQALKSLIDAGILDENTNFTEPYKNLEKILKFNGKDI